MRRNVRYGLNGVVVLVCLGLGSRAMGQGTAKDIFKEMDAKAKGKAKGIEDQLVRDLNVLSVEVQGQKAKLLEVLGLAEGLKLANDNEYRKAMTKYKVEVEKFKRFPETNRTPQQKRFHVEALLELGRLLAIMGERDQGYAAILEAADALEKLDERPGRGKASRCNSAGAAPSPRCSARWNGRWKPTTTWTGR